MNETETTSGPGATSGSAPAGPSVPTVHRIALIPGDGIGPDVIREGCRVLEEVARRDGRFRFAFETFLWNSDHYLRYGEMMPKDGLEQLAHFDAIFLGAVGDPRVPDHITLRGLLLPIRQGFDQYVNLRPIKLLRGAPTPLAGRQPEDIDMLFIRENSEGEYAGQGGFLFPGTPREVALQTAVFSRHGVERVVRYAFGEARRRGQSLTSVSKGNALNYSAVLWDRVFAEVAREFPDVKTYNYLVDAAALYMVREPKRYGVVVASNLFGDILTDLGAAIAGGLGLAAGANLNPERLHPSMFEPIHGSAPDIAGKGIANPMAAIWTAALMLDHLGYAEWHTAVVNAIEALLVAGKNLPPDLGGTAHTPEVTDGILDLLAG